MNLKNRYAAAALLLTISIIYLQLSALPDIRSCALEQAGIDVSISAVKSCLTATSAVAATLALTLAAGIAGTALLKGHFAILYIFLERKRKEWAIVAAVTAVAAIPYLARGNVVLGDAMQFSALSIFMKESLLNMTYPYWTFHWYMGSAPLAYYGWLSFLATGTGNLFMPIDWANKLIFFLAHIGSALIAYKFVKTATGNTKAAIIAGLAYGLSFEHIARVMIGRSLTALTYLLTPLLFLTYELRLADKTGKYRFIAATAALMALLIFNHQADAMLITAIFAVYAASRTLESGRNKIKTVAAELAIAAVIAIGITSFWILPMLLERGEASATGKAMEILTPSLPHLNDIKELISWPGLWGDKPFYYIGLSALLPGLAGIFYLIKNKKIAVAATTAAALILLLFQSPRYMPATLLMIAVSAGYGFIYLSAKMDGKKLLLIVAAAMILDMAPATLQLGYPDFSYNKQFYDTINAQDGERILDLATDRRTFWPAYAYINNHAETVFGTLIESAPRSLPYAAAISQMAASEYYDRKQGFSDETLQGFYMLGVKYVVVHTEQIGKSPREVFAEKRGALGLERGLEIVELRQSPLIAAARIERINYEPSLEKEEGWKMRSGFEERSIDTTEVEMIIDAMRLNTETGVADRILAKDGQDEATNAANLSIKTGKTTTTAGRTAIEYEINNEAFLQLSYSHSPLLSVKIDGEEAEYRKTAINTIAVRTKEGRHIITIEGEQSGLRKLLLAVSAASLLLAFYLLKKNA